LKLVELADCDHRNKPFEESYFTATLYRSS
jgi:hypothetical protein